ncbi:MAG: hydrogenase maturation protease [Pseudomonadota bacterium]
MTARPLILGLGNPHRGDDGAGAAVAGHLRSAACDIRLSDGEATDILDAWQAYDEVVTLDAAAPAGRPGRIRAHASMGLAGEYIPTPASSHGLGLREAVRLGAALALLPRRLYIYTIEGADFTAGAPLSSPVAKAVQGLARILMGRYRHPC